ncbi:Nitrate/nitrite response regulator protein NarL [Paraconexibacter sp. AEG42_29]|uniref:Nitrate/nitrite response regulator protein NarL n=1 Tax=Paraconexibacter sp. AEG42_29 TaxID=2997339 RepID=A0AAU7B3U7_9ACTN
MVLCDDVPQLRTLLRYAIDEHADLEVVGEAGDGQAGVDLIESLTPDAVVLDLSMPGLDGLEVIPRIRERSPGTSIIVFSGFTADRMAREALELGADRYLEKGEDIDTVVASIRDAVEHRRVA